MGDDTLRAKLEELRRLAAVSRSRLVEIAAGIEHLRQELNEIGSTLNGGGAPGIESPGDRGPASESALSSRNA